MECLAGYLYTNIMTNNVFFFSNISNEQLTINMVKFPQKKLIWSKEINIVNLLNWL